VERVQDPSIAVELVAQPEADHTDTADAADMPDQVEYTADLDSEAFVLADSRDLDTANSP
jgi:hypothetical protein